MNLIKTDLPFHFIKDQAVGDDPCRLRIIRLFGIGSLGTSKIENKNLNEIFSSRDSEEIDSEEAQDRFIHFAKKKWCYGSQPAKKGVIDQIEHSVAITVELYTFIESRQSYTRHKAIKDLDNIDFSLSTDRPNIWDIE